MTTMNTPGPISIPSPRSGTRNGQRSNFELYSWLFMRISGIVLVFLVLGHLLIMNILDGGVQRINFAFVAGRWSSPFWQFWDLALLWLAQLHGGNGYMDEYPISRQYTDAKISTAAWKRPGTPEVALRAACHKKKQANTPKVIEKIRESMLKTDRSTIPPILWFCQWVKW